MAQIRSIVSESLEAQIRNLLPSQAGFTEDLQAQNVIVPVIDLTSAAEGSSTPEFLQTSLAFGSQTAFDVTNSTSTLINTTGFYRVYGVAQLLASSGSVRSGSLSLTDGLSSKKIFEIDQLSAGTNDNEHIVFDFNVFLGTGESLTCTATLNCSFVGSTRQIADVNGVLTNPSGFSPQ